MVKLRVEMGTLLIHHVPISIAFAKPEFCTVTFYIPLVPNQVGPT